MIFCFAYFTPYPYRTAQKIRGIFFSYTQKRRRSFPLRRFCFTRVPRSYLTKVILRICEKSPASRL